MILSPTWPEKKLPGGYVLAATIFSSALFWYNRGLEEENE